MTNDDLRVIEQARDIYIYGAGYVAHQAISFLSLPLFKFGIRGICTTKDEGLAELRGFPVTVLSKLHTIPEKTVFVIAVSSKYQQEIADYLEENGYHYYFFYDEQFQRDVQLLAGYTFTDRRKHLKKMCMILSGYKEWLWDRVFDRAERFIPDDVEVCILSSGLRSECLEAIAEKNAWSYLSTDANCLTLIQNIAMNLFDDAEWIFKMDEDIFLTKNCFKTMFETGIAVRENEPYELGFVAPLIPVNGYGYIRILDELGMRSEYEARFDRVLFGGYPEKMIENNADACAYMWGIDDSIPKLDLLNRICQERACMYSFCNVRFSIGFILFHRELWDKMGGFRVSGGNDLGVDEIDLCSYCMVRSKAIVVAENTVVGHFSFGKQTTGMRRVLETKPELFDLEEG